MKKATLVLQITLHYGDDVSFRFDSPVLINNVEIKNVCACRYFVKLHFKEIGTQISNILISLKAIVQVKTITLLIMFFPFNFLIIECDIDNCKGLLVRYFILIYVKFTFYLVYYCTFCTIRIKTSGI